MCSIIFCPKYEREKEKQRETDWQIEREKGREKNNKRIFHITGGRAIRLCKRLYAS